MSGGGPAALPSENKAPIELPNWMKSEASPLYTVHSRHGPGVWRLRLLCLDSFCSISYLISNVMFNGLCIGDGSNKYLIYHSCITALHYGSGVDEDAEHGIDSMVAPLSRRTKTAVMFRCSGTVGHISHKVLHFQCWPAAVRGPPVQPTLEASRCHPSVLSSKRWHQIQVVAEWEVHCKSWSVLMPNGL